jgi:hypothetical protein
MYVWWQPLRLDGLSRPTLLLGTHAGTELACTSYITGVQGGEVWGGGVVSEGRERMEKGVDVMLGLLSQWFLAWYVGF